MTPIRIITKIPTGARVSVLCCPPSYLLLPKPIIGIPQELITLGDHIKKKRLENNLFQKDVGKIIVTDNFTIVN